MAFLNSGRRSLRKSDGMVPLRSMQFANMRLVSTLLHLGDRSVRIPWHRQQTYVIVYGLPCLSCGLGRVRRWWLRWPRVPVRKPSHGKPFGDWWKEEKVLNISRIYYKKGNTGPASAGLDGKDQKLVNVLKIVLTQIVNSSTFCVCVCLLKPATCVMSFPEVIMVANVFTSQKH